MKKAGTRFHEKFKISIWTKFYLFLIYMETRYMYYMSLYVCICTYTWIKMVRNFLNKYIFSLECETIIWKVMLFLTETASNSACVTTFLESPVLAWWWKAHSFVKGWRLLRTFKTKPRWFEINSTCTSSTLSTTALSTCSERISDFFWADQTCISS